ncbi:MAG: hypothetical protein GX556_19870 [Fibrobacter sp.]|nr:hypothetical protein [Fibrobacter sp.]
MKTWLKQSLIWTGRLSLSLLFLVVITGVTAFILAHLPVGQKFIIDIAGKSIDSVLIGEISIGKFRTNLFSRIEISNVVLKDQNGRLDSVSVNHISINYNLLPLLFKTVQIHSVHVDGVDGVLSVTPEGRYIFPVMPRDTSGDTIQPTDSQGVSWKFDLGTVQVTDINAEYIDSALFFKGHISGASASARFPRIDSIYLNLRVPDGFYESPWWRGHVDTIGGAGLLRFDKLHVQELFVSGSGSEVRGNGTIPFSEFGYWDLTADVESEMKPLLAIHGLVPGVAPVGKLFGKGSWNGTLQKPVLKFSGSGKGLQYDHIDVDSLYVDGSYGLNSTVFLSADLFSNPVKAVLKADWQIFDLMSRPVFSHYTGDLQARRVAVSQIEKKQLVTKKFPGLFVDLTLHVDGAGIESLPKYFKIDSKICGGIFKDQPLYLNAVLDRSNWKLDSDLAGNILYGEGKMNLKDSISGSFSGDFRELETLSRIFKTEPVSGSLVFNGDLEGEFINPRVNVTLSSTDLKWRSVQIDSLEASGANVNGEINIGSAFARGTVGLDTVLEFFNVDSAGGTLGFQIRGSGSVDSINGQGSFTGSGIYYSGYRADSMYGNFAFDSSETIVWNSVKIIKNQSEIINAGTLNIRDLRLNTEAQIRLSDGSRWKDAGDASFGGSFGNDSMQGQFQINELSLPAVSSWFPWLAGREGTISGSGGFGGSIKNLNGHVLIQHDNPGFRNKRVFLADNRFMLVDSLLSFDSDFFLHDSGSKLEITAQIPFNPSLGWRVDTSGYRTANARVNGSSLKLSALGAILGTDWSADGPLNLSASVSNQNGSWNLDGLVGVKNGSFGYIPDNTSVSGINLNVDLSGTVQAPVAGIKIETGRAVVPGGIIDSTHISGTAGLDTLVLNSSRLYFPRRGLVEIEGRTPLDKPDSILFSPGLVLDFVVHRFPVSLLRSFIPENMVRRGVLRGSGRIRASQGRPLLRGQLSLDSSEIELVDIEPRITSVNGQISLSGDSVIIDRFSGKWGDGDFKGNGVAVWDMSGLNHLGIDVAARNVSFEMIDVADVRINSTRLHLSNSRDGFLLSGDIDLGPTRYIRDIRIADLTGQRVYREPDQFLRNLMLQIKVNSLENLTVDMNLGYMETEGDVTLSGTAAVPGYTGEIRLSSGYILYLDRSFEITKGSIYNYDPYKLNPVLNLEAQTEVVSISAVTGDPLSYIIYMTLSGTLEEPVVMFRSEGENGGGLSQADIISVLTLGQPLGAIGGNLGERLRAFAGESLLGFGSRKLEQLLGIERIDIRGDIFAMDSVYSPRLTLTKRIGPRLTLSYETMLGDLAQRRISALFRLTRRFFLKGETDSEGESGVDLIFRLSR